MVAGAARACGFFAGGRVIPGMVKRRGRELALLTCCIGLPSIVTAFCRIFSNRNLVSYDDEGMLMIVIRRFLEKRALYDDLSTIYGPLYYFYEWCVHAVTGAPVSHDSVQFVSLFFWVTSALLIFLLVYRVTDSLLAAAAAHFLAFGALGLIGVEPAHPQELCITLLAALGLAACCIGNRIALMASLGALAAAVVATKINLGVFVAVALALALLAALRRGWLRSVLCITAGAAALACPIALMWGHRADLWAERYCFVAVVSLGAAMVAVSRLEFEYWTEFSDFLWAGSGFAAVIAAVSWFAVAHGSSVHGMLDSLIFQPRRSFGGSWFRPAEVPGVAVPWASAGLACAILVAFRRATWKSATDSTVALLKVTFAVGVGVCCFVGRNADVMNCASPFIWLVAVRLGAAAPHRINSLPRAILALVTVIQILYAYPVAGLQTVFTTVMMIVTAAICLADSLPFLRYRFPLLSTGNLPRAAVLVSASALTMLYVFGTASALQDYRTGEPLGLPGAGLMRLEHNNAVLVRDLAGRIDSSPCTMLASAPGLLSFNFVTGRPAPRAINFSSWMLVLNDAGQEKAIAELSGEPYPCVLYNQSLIDFWTRGMDASSRPLIRFIRENFKVVYEASGYRLMEPRLPGPVRLAGGAGAGGGKLVLRTRNLR